jgi:hypothetical protein
VAIRLQNLHQHRSPPPAAKGEVAKNNQMIDESVALAVAALKVELSVAEEARLVAEQKTAELLVIIEAQKADALKIAEEARLSAEELVIEECARLRTEMKAEEEELSKSL